MISRSVLLGVLWLPSALFAAQPDADLLKIYSAAREVESQAQMTLHVSVRAIALLLNAGPGMFQPQAALEREGKMPLLIDMQERGYITLTTRMGLPDASRPDEKFVQCTATDKGRMVISALTP